MGPRRSACACCKTGGRVWAALREVNDPEMKHDNLQLPLLFPMRPALPSRSFTLDPSPDEIRICTGCGRQILVRRRTAEGKVVREFVSAAGTCWDCVHPI